MSDDGHDDGHVDLDTLAELAEHPEDERGPTARDSEARAHLAACPQCQQQAANLAEVQRVLAAAPPVSMPDHVLARIDASLSAAADEDETVAAVPHSARRSARWLLRPLAGSSRSRGSTPAARDRRSPARRPWHQRRPLRVGLAAAATVVIGVGGVATTRALLTDEATVTSAESGAPDSREMAPGAGDAPAARPLQGSGNAGPQVIATGSNYSAHSVDEQVAALVRGRTAQGTQDESARSQGQPPRALRPLADPSRLRGCIGDATGDADRRPAVVDLARYDGEPAAVVVFSDRGQWRLDVWIVSATCTADDSNVLLHTQVPR